jgi:hypothetical protein
MDFSGYSGHGYLLIAGLILVGGGFLIISLIVNARVASSARQEERHREKLFEYYRNTFSQLGVILIGIGVSLFIFFFQQNYQDQRKREAEIQQVLAKIGLRIGRAIPLVESLNELDGLLDDGGPYVKPEEGGANRAVTARGPDLARQVRDVLLIERDIDLEAFENLNFSRDFEASFVVNELDPDLWLNIARDESDIDYATDQLTMDFKDLHDALGGDPVETALADPEKEPKIKAEMLDIFYDADLLRHRSRQLLGRACWFFATGPEFLALRPIDELEAEYASHKEWLDHAARIYAASAAGQEDCFKILRYRQSSPD